MSCAFELILLFRVVFYPVRFLHEIYVRFAVNSAPKNGVQEKVIDTAIGSYVLDTFSLQG